MQRRLVTVKLSDGPCSGTHARVLSLGEDCWQKLDRNDDVWLRYVKNIFIPGEYIWTGEARTTQDQVLAMLRDKENTYGMTEGA